VPSLDVSLRLAPVLTVKAPHALLVAVQADRLELDAVGLTLGVFLPLFRRRPRLLGLDALANRLRVRH
jgi:hypothetical protein